MTLTKSLIKADIIAARQAIEYYELKGIKSIKNIAAYHLQQATEKIIKYQIYESGVTIDNSQIYTHNIERLLVYGDSLGISLNVPDYIREKTARITDWEAGSRYDMSFSIRIDLLKKTYDVIEKWFSRI
ncbi:MAG: HEPN domain-containing protein [Lachnospiraceae bacterium]|nr:HEPN domain-containing protein [Lachnospiraceae bacterium]